MDRSQILLLGLPIFLFCSDILNLFTTSPPPKPTPNDHHNIHQFQTKSQQVLQQQPPQFPTQKSSTIVGGLGNIGFGNVIDINFCVSCSYRGTAVTMKNMLESEFPGIQVILANHPASLQAPTQQSSSCCSVWNNWDTIGRRTDFSKVFSKLMEHRFPGEIELRDVVGKRLANR